MKSCSLPCSSDSPKVDDSQFHQKQAHSSYSVPAYLVLEYKALVSLIIQGDQPFVVTKSIFCDKRLLTLQNILVSLKNHSTPQTNTFY